MELSAKILSDLIIFSKYARYLEELKRRETWEEIVQRNMNMHIKKFPFLEEEIKENYKLVLEKKVLPSMRSMQFAGKPIEINPIRMFNCSFLAINDIRAFSEIMFLLLSGAGAGFSIMRHHIDELPEIKRPLPRKKRFLIGDNVEGWAESVKILIKSYFFAKSEPEFDFRDIRSKGTPILTAGGLAPGPEPLKTCLYNIKKVLDRKETGEKLKPIEAYDIVNYISDAVLSGGIRRSACLALFSLEDEEMLTSKSGNWFELNPQRARSNNTVMFLRHRVKKKDFEKLWNRIKTSTSGEPGFLWSNDMEYGTNPCSEISLKNMGLCNLTEINTSDIESQEDFNNRAKVASFIGSLQASWTDFHYLRDSWKKNAEKEALLGISLTGIASNNIFKYNIEEAVEICKKENERISQKIGINPALRLTCVKPSGTASSVLGTSSGIHAWHSPYYIRRIRLNKDEPIYQYLIEKIPQLVEEDFAKPSLGAVVSIPIKSPEGSSYRDEDVLDLLTRVKQISDRWISPGHIKGGNKNNVSCTVSVKKEDWDKVGEWMWKNKECYTALSVLPYFSNETCYVQLPFEECTKEKYEELLQYVKQIDLSEIKEYDDKTNLQGEAACSANGCTITHL
jgi:ribonucleoside-diphosphate reductase alpha chain